MASAKEETIDVDAIKRDLDQTLDDLFKDVLPSTPYICRFPPPGPSQPPHRPTPLDWDQHWKRGSFWKSGEFELQYLTFNRHPGGPLQSHGNWDDGNGGLASSAKAKSHISKAQTPTQVPGVKKTISLADYKNRGARRAVGEAVTPLKQSPNQESGIKQHAEKHSKSPREPAGKASDEKVEVLNFAPNHSTKTPSQSVEHARSESRGNINSLSSVGESRQSSEKPSSRKRSPERLPSPNPPKKRRLSSDENSQKDVKASPVCSQSNNQKRDSSALTNGVGHLSKDPPQKESASSHKANGNNTTPFSNGEKVSRLPPMLSPTLRSVNNLKLPPLLSPNLPPSIENILKEYRAAKIERRKGLKRSHDSQMMSSNHTRSLSPMPTTDSVQYAQPSKSEEKLSLIAILRFKNKTNRKTVASYVRLRPTPNMGFSTPVRNTKSEHLSHKPAHKPHLTSPKLAKKEDLSRLPRPTRKDGQEVLGKTPNFPGSSPPELSPPAAKRPRVEPRTAPASHQARPSLDQKTPAGLSVLDQTKQEYRREFDRLLQLGRDLKHDSDKYLKDFDQKPRLEQQIGTMIAIESVLTYMLAALIKNEVRRRSGEPGRVDIWEGILEFLCPKSEQAKPFTHLSGLLLQLEGVTRDYVRYHNVHSIQQAVQKEPNEAFMQLIKESNNNEMRGLAAWREGQSKLWIEDWQRDFPRTWAMAHKTPGRGKAQDGVEINAYGKDGFALPLTQLTSGLEAVNTGMAFIEEYCAKHRVKWTPKLRL